MIAHSGTCQDLGFVCEWRVFADTEESVADGLLEHLNRVHGTGSTSPALHSLVRAYVTDLSPARANSPTHSKEHVS